MNTPGPERPEGIIMMHICSTDRFPSRLLLAIATMGVLACSSDHDTADHGSDAASADGGDHGTHH
jgi:hypothetical protein